MYSVSLSCAVVPEAKVIYNLFGGSFFTVVENPARFCKYLLDDYYVFADCNGGVVVDSVVVNED